MCSAYHLAGPQVQGDAVEEQKWSLGAWLSGLKAGEQRPKGCQTEKAPPLVSDEAFIKLAATYSPGIKSKYHRRWAA